MSVYEICGVVALCQYAVVDKVPQLSLILSVHAFLIILYADLYLIIFLC